MYIQKQTEKPYLDKHLLHLLTEQHPNHFASVLATYGADGTTQFADINFEYLLQ